MYLFSCFDEYTPKNVFDLSIAHVVRVAW